jgi:hypothetical protein
MAWGCLAVAMVAAVGWAQPPAGLEPADSLAGPRYGATIAIAPGEVNSSAAVSQLAQQFAKATKEDDKKEIRKKLTEALGAQFDQRAEQQKKELDDLEKQVAALKALMKKRHDARDAIIERRLDQVLQEAEGLGWGGPQRRGNDGGFSNGFRGGFNIGGPAPQRR